MGPDFLEPVTTDYDLEREGKILDRLPPQQLDHVVRKLVGVHFRRAYAFSIVSDVPLHVRKVFRACYVRERVEGARL